MVKMKSIFSMYYKLADTNYTINFNKISKWKGTIYMEKFQHNKHD